jgi:hypothetical protein
MLRKRKIIIMMKLKLSLEIRIIENPKMVLKTVLILA